MEQKLELVVEVDDKGLITGIKKIDKNEEEHHKKQKKRNKEKVSSFKKVGKAIKGLGNIYTAVIGTVVIGALGKAVKAASDFNESNAKFQTTFAQVGTEANKMRDELVNSYNMSTSAATELMATTGDMLSGFGFAADEALNLSGETQKLAADLASFANVPVKQASEAITKGLLGEREMMKSLGISINETDLKQRLMAEGKDKLTGMALKQARAEMTLKMAMEQSKNAIGDVSRTQDSFANVMKSVKNTVSDMSIIIGQKLLKHLHPMVKQFRDFIKSEDGIKKITNALKGLVTGVVIIKAVFAQAFDSIQMQIGNVKAVVQTLGDAFTAIKNRDFKAFKEAMKNGTSEIGNNIAEFAGNTVGRFKDTFGEIKEIWKETETAQIEGVNAVADANTVAQQNIRTENEKTLALEKEQEEERKKLAEKRKESIKQVGDMISQTNSNIGASVEGLGKLTSRWIDANIKDEEERDKKKKESAKAFAIASRVVAIFDIINNTAMAIMNAASSIPFPYNIPVMASAGTMGAIQTAVVASNPLPSFATGGFTGEPSTTNPSGTDTIPAMLAGGENIFNQRQSRNLHSALDMAGLLSDNSRNKTRDRMMMDKRDMSTRKSIHIHGNVYVDKPDDMFNDQIDRRLAKGGTFV